MLECACMHACVCVCVFRRRDCYTCRYSTSIQATMYTLPYIYVLYTLPYICAHVTIGACSGVLACMHVCVGSETWFCLTCRYSTYICRGNHVYVTYFSCTLMSRNEAFSCIHANTHSSPVDTHVYVTYLFMHNHITEHTLLTYSCTIMSQNEAFGVTSFVAVTEPDTRYIVQHITCI